MSFHSSPGGGNSRYTGIENGNRLGERPVVRQSKFFRENESGNQMKNILGHDNLSWDADKQQGVFQGQSVYDGRTQAYNGGQQALPPPQQQQQRFSPQQQQQHQPAFPPQQQQRFSPPQPPSQEKRVCFGGAANSAGAPTRDGQSAARRAITFGGPGAQSGAPPPRAPPSQAGPSRGPPPSSQAGPSRGPPPQAAHAPPPAGGEIEYPWPGSVCSCDACGSVVDRYYHCIDCQEATGLFDLCVRCCGSIYLNVQGGLPLVAHPTHDYKSHRMQHVIP